MDWKQTLASIVRPTLVVDEARVRRNISRMARRAAENGPRFRPHVKTHQSLEMGVWMRQAGASAITVSSLEMAEYFAAAGFDDITLAFHLNPRELPAATRLAGRIRLGLLVDNPAAAAALDRLMENPVSVWIKVDTGTGRTGLDWSDVPALTALAAAAHRPPRLTLRGLLTHAGHTYRAGSPEEVRRRHRESLDRMRQAKAALAQRGFAGLEISIGDTPGACLGDDFTGADEIRPGVFVFYDLTQLGLGVCAEDDLAVALACPVVGVYPERGELAVHGGAVHLSKESMPAPDGGGLYGRPALPTADGWGEIWPDAWVRGVSQEHGLLKAPKKLLERVGIGDLIMILPVHVCLTADLMGEYLTLDGRRIVTMRRRCG